MKERFNSLEVNGTRIIDFFVNKQPYALILAIVTVASGILAVVQKNAVLAGISAAGVGTGLLMIKNEIIESRRRRK